MFNAYNSKLKNQSAKITSTFEKFYALWETDLNSKSSLTISSRLKFYTQFIFIILDDIEKFFVVQLKTWFKNLRNHCVRFLLIEKNIILK